MLRYLNSDFLQFVALLIVPTWMIANQLIANAQILRTAFI